MTPEPCKTCRHADHAAYLKGVPYCNHWACGPDDIMGPWAEHRPVGKGERERREREEKAMREQGLVRK